MNQSVVNEINNINMVIDDNISEKDYLNRGLLSQNILAQLRNLVEDVIVLWYNKNNNTDLDTHFKNKKIAYKSLEAKCNPRFLNEFHRYLQTSKSHYTPDYNGAERLMQKYYYYLLKLKEYVKNEFNIEILLNISKYPLNNDTSLLDYYKKIAHEIKKVEIGSTNKLDNARYYIEKTKPFEIDGDIYYEITLSTATDKMNKFDRMIAYTKYDILPNYAITISFVEREISLFSSKTTIKIINNWRVAIRSCEINNLSKIFCNDNIVKSNMNEYNNLMNYLTKENINLLNLVLMSDGEYLVEKRKIGVAKTDYIFKLLDSCRYLIKNKNNGYKVIRYLLYNMRNIVIKRQLNRLRGENIPTEFMSNLCLKRSCFPFEKLPFVMSLVKHIPSGEDLFMSLDSENCEEQLLARHILNNIEQKGIMYTDIDELLEYGDTDKLISKFNRQLYGEQKRLKIIKEHNYVFMEGYEKSTIDIINIINELSTSGIDGYQSSYEFWEMFDGYSQDISEEKKEILRKMYNNSKVSLIYGAAGTGKTTMISCLSEYLSDKKKIFLTNTNTAIENLRRRIKVINSEFYTIAEYINNDYIEKNCDILIIDECSTVSNQDILDVLNNTNFELLLLVGDIYQIESINFGNWFSFAKEFVNEFAIHELSETFRSDDETLLELWKKVRNCEDTITEYIVNNNFSSDLNQDIFNKLDDDEIILCLGYDGLYGINQINKYLQDFNNNEKFDFGIKSYKVGDPVLFFDTNRFGNVLYNNLKGVITNISQNDDEMYFEIEIEKPLTSLDVFGSNVSLIETKQFSSIVGFKIDKEFENDDDDDDKNNIVPFNIAYALSIHKAQGLEYNSVKVVLTKDVEKLISPNIFYTAITRAKKNLRIFWTTETGQCIIDQFKNNSSTKDYNIFKNKYNL